MKLNQAYFQRNRGHWFWRARFQVNNWRGLLLAPLEPVHKLRLISMVLGQPLLGYYDLRTYVDPAADGQSVRHLTIFSKWGLCFLYSEKVFALSADGQSLSLTGQEHYWPQMGKATAFGPLPGQILPSGYEAVYRMPLLNLPCDFRTLLNGEEGWIRLDAGWMTAEITLTPASMAQLRARMADALPAL